jgi:lysophospholipase L1-like esterase
LDLKKVKLSSLPTPGFVKDEIQPFIDDVIDINDQLRASGATRIQAINQTDGSLTIIGVQAAGATVAESTLANLKSAASSAGTQTDLVAPGGNIVPRGRTGSETGSPVYLALGDSLSANEGVSDARDGYVSRFHSYLESTQGETLGLINLGISGESSISIHDGQLERALSTLASEQVSVLTIDLGANDLIAHVGSDSCQQNFSGEACVERITAALAAFEDNFGGILTDLKTALPSGASFYVMTVYNPFDFGIGLPSEEFSSGVIAELNLIIASEAARVGARLADPFDEMADNAGAWTNMLDGLDIHPNADGYQVLALSLAEAAE